MDEFQAVGRNPLYQLLNDLQVKQERKGVQVNSALFEEKNTHVIAICILDALEDMNIDLSNKGCLLIRENVFNSLNGEEVTHQVMTKTSPGKK